MSLIYRALAVPCATCGAADGDRCVNAAGQTHRDFAHAARKAAAVALFGIVDPTNPNDQRHGSTAGYYLHRRAGERPCGPCRAAINEDMAYRREVAR